jgi:hypothetical protein
MAPLENLLWMAFSGMNVGGISSEFLVENTQRRNIDKAVKKLGV